MKFTDLLSQLPTEVIVEFTGQAAQADYNPAARWVSKILVRELALRQGEPQMDVPALSLDEGELQFADEWLDHTAQTYTEAGVDQQIGGLVLLGAVLDRVRTAILARAASPTH